MHGTSLVAEERVIACKTARLTETQGKATTTSPGDHGVLCI